MPALNSILVGVDFSPCSASALLHASALATRCGATLHVEHVVKHDVVLELATSLGRTVEQTTAELVESAASQLDSFVGGHCGTDSPSHPRLLHVSVGDAADALAERGRQVAASLLVLGVYGEGGSGMGSGHVSLGSVRSSPCTVLLVHEKTKRPLKTLIAAVDFAPSSTVALDLASRLAEIDGATLRLLHVYYAPWHRLHYRAPTEESSPEFQRQYLDRLHGLVADLAERERAAHPGLRVEVDLVDDASPGRAILEHATTHAADLIALGTRRDGRLRKLFLGSNAERVLRRLDVSVVVGRASDDTA